VPIVPLTAQEPRSRVGTVVADKYRVVRVLGRGGMGTVYEAVHTSIGKHVALKFLEGHVDDNAQARARFLREAQTASLVESPHVVHIFDSGWSDDGAPFMVLELLRGQDLRAYLRSEGRLPIEQAVAIAEQTLRALIQTHAAGIVHRDLKPENIFLCEIEGSEPLVKVLDFGISKVTLPQETLDTLTHQGTVLGTTYYMSPEQAQGAPDVDARSDIYGLGGILYEMLTGRTPHVGNVQHAVLVEICTRDAPDVRLLAPQVPEELAHIIARALSRNREDRFESAQAFLNALGPFSQMRTGPNPWLTATRVSQPSLSAPVNGTPSPVAVAGRRSGRSVALGLLLALVLAATGIVVVHKRLKGERARERAALWQAATAASSPSSSNHISAIVAPALNPPTAGTTVSSTPSSSPDAASSHTSRHPATTAGTATRSPNRPANSETGELQLKTTMP
jgi:eukaryotic-like serine/threonine-protein kinase